MNSILNIFKDLVDSKTSSSSTRGVLVFTTIFSNVIVWSTWFILCIVNNNIIDIPLGVYTALGIANGIPMIGKAWQYKKEKKINGDNNETV